MPSNASSTSSDPLEDFAAVLAVLQLGQIPVEAARLRDEANRSGQCRNELPIVGKPLHGSFNILYPIDFSDGTRWLVKIPMDGVSEEWDESSAAALASEAMTMRLIKQHTSIPVPEIYSFSSTLDNPLACPHIFMSFIPGMPLQELWFNPDLSESELHLSRTQVLEEIAAAMVQLDRFSFPLGGQILFNGGQPVGVGPCREGHDEQGFEAGPFKTSRDFYTCIMDKHPAASLDRDPHTLSLLIGQERLLRLFIDCIAEMDFSQDNGFVLTHPDFDLQNFIVSTDGHLMGVIDWDDVGVWPKSLGNRRYPGWLTRDWDPALYGYADGDTPPDGQREDPPATLALCRKAYREAMSRISQSGTLETSVTLITENISIAAKDTGFRYPILRKIVQEIALTVETPSDIEAYDVCLDLGKDMLDNGLRETLRKGFIKLLHDESL
ncbi:kinase-like domain-containing protein [Stachybotrys elegans]|uniref:Kinase-like domain-containing protein n=1 Tax=Stachybotrys elegans TaxID=80388 RepID=A0A8K0SAS2_9HYPO|nr:kinase-like domain-containing protein [Stachybotrys elegans]